MEKDEKDKVVSEEILGQAVGHIDAAATLLGMKFKLLFDAKNAEDTVGFVIAKEEVFSGELEVVQEKGTWSPAPRPKQLN